MRYKILFIALTTIFIASIAYMIIRPSGFIGMIFGEMKPAPSGIQRDEKFINDTLIDNLGCSTKNKAETQGSADTTETKLTIEDKAAFNGPCVFERRGVKKDTFPFSVSDKVELVSYECRRDSYTNDNLISDDRFSVDNIKQRVTLDRSQKDSLFSILHNYKPLPAGLDTLQADCYSPRHSIVFYKKSKAVAFFEVCFECGGTRQSKGVDFGQFCPEKMCRLQNFFKTNGADFGIIAEMCE